MKRRMDMKKPILLIVLLLLGAVVVHAQTPYYQGKTIRIVTGYPAGDVNDLWPRLIAQHMTKYIPGICLWANGGEIVFLQFDRDSRQTNLFNARHASDTSVAVPVLVLDRFHARKLKGSR